MVVDISFSPLNYELFGSSRKVAGKNSRMMLIRARNYRGFKHVRGTQFFGTIGVWPRHIDGDASLMHDAVAPATRVAEKVRLLIITRTSPSLLGRIRNDREFLHQKSCGQR
jgi:hypothetical protein